MYLSSGRLFVGIVKKGYFSDKQHERINSTEYLTVPVNEPATDGKFYTQKNRELSPIDFLPKHQRLCDD